MADHWTEIKLSLKGRFAKTTYDTVFAGSEAAYNASDQRLTIQVKDAKVAEWANHQLKARTAEILQAANGWEGLTDVVFQPGLTQTRPGRTAETPIEPRAGEAAIQLENSLDDGFVMVRNYETIFWQPYLKPGPFAFWVTLRAFAWDSRHGAGWPSIELLTEICAKGQRYKVTGRPSRNVPGYIEELSQAGILIYNRAGRTPAKYRYYFKTLTKLPMMTPTEARALTSNLQEKHLEALERAEVDIAAWQTIQTVTFIPKLTF